MRAAPFFARAQSKGSKRALPLKLRLTMSIESFTTLPATSFKCAPASFTASTCPASFAAGQQPFDARHGGAPRAPRSNIFVRHSSSTGIPAAVIRVRDDALARNQESRTCSRREAMMLLNRVSARVQRAKNVLERRAGLTSDQAAALKAAFRAVSVVAQNWVKAIATGTGSGSASTRAWTPQSTWIAMAVGPDSLPLALSMMPVSVGEQQDLLKDASAYIDKHYEPKRHADCNRAAKLLIEAAIRHTPAPRGAPLTVEDLNGAMSTSGQMLQTFGDELAVTCALAAVGQRLGRLHSREPDSLLTLAAQAVKTR